MAASSVQTVIMTMWQLAKHQHDASMMFLLTVNDYIHIFHVRRSHVVASFALVAAGLVPHDADDVEIFLSIQRLRCRKE